MLNGNSTGCASSLCYCLAICLQESNFFLCIFGMEVIFCFPLLSSSISFKSGMERDSFLHRETSSSMVQIPSRLRTLAQLILSAAQLLKEKKQYKFSACSSSFVVSEQQIITLPSPDLYNPAPCAPPWPHSMDSLDRISSGLIKESDEMMPPPYRSPRILLWPQEFCSCLNKRNIRPINVQSGF